MIPSLKFILLLAQLVLIRVCTVVHPAVVLVSVNLAIAEIVWQTAVNRADIWTEHGLLLVFHLSEILLVSVFLDRGGDRCFGAASVHINAHFFLIIIEIVLNVHFLEAHRALRSDFHNFPGVSMTLNLLLLKAHNNLFGLIELFFFVEHHHALRCSRLLLGWLLLLDLEDAIFDPFIGHGALHGIGHIYWLAPIDMLNRCDVVLSASSTPSKFHDLEARERAHRGVVRVALSRCGWADGALVESSLWERLLGAVRRHYLLDLVAHFNLLCLFLFYR